MGMKQIFFFFFRKKNSKWPTQKKLIFQNRQFSNELFSDSLTAIYVELHQCPSHHSILLTQGRIWEIFAKKFWELAILKNELFLSRPFWIFFSKKNFFFCFIPMKISPNLYGRMDGSKYWCFPWFPENSLLCVILCYTVYAIFSCLRLLRIIILYDKK